MHTTAVGTLQLLVKTVLPILNKVRQRRARREKKVKKDLERNSRIT